MPNTLHTSSKIVAAALFGVAILGFALWKSPFFNTSRTNTPTLTTAQEREPLSDEYAQDSDNDGVANWEEVLLGTDPNNPDSDDDGVPDGEELQRARASLSASAQIQEANSTNGTTNTDILAREIFGAYIQSKQQGTYDPAAFEFIISQSAEGHLASRPRSNYSEADLSLTPDISTQQTLRYERAFQDALLPVTQIPEYELTTYGRAVQTQDESEFAKLVSAADIYAGIASSLISITAPTDAQEPHLDLVQAFDVFAQVLMQMSTSPEDPLLSFVATRNFIEAEDAIKAAYAQMDIYFTLKEDTTL